MSLSQNQKKKIPCSHNTPSPSPQKKKTQKTKKQVNLPLMGLTFIKEESNWNIMCSLLTILIVLMYYCSLALLNSR